MGPWKLRDRVFLRNYSKWNLNFQNWSKVLSIGDSEPTKWLPAQSTAYDLCNGQVNQAFVKENENNICVKEIWICKTLEINGWIFFPSNVFSLLESCQLYIIEKYKASNCCRTEAVIQRCSINKLFLKIL